MLTLFFLWVRAISLIQYKPLLNSGQLPVSVVIAARNEGDKLEKLVDSIFKQSHSDFELIIILDRCSDNSLDLMKKLEKQYPSLKTLIVDYLPDHFSPKKYALTLGIKRAKNECVLLTDADCLPKSTLWITKMSQAFTESTDFVVGYSPHKNSPGWLYRLIAYETFITGFKYLTTAIIHRPFMAVGRNLVLRKSFFLKINGYNKYQHVQGGDDDLLVQYHATSNNTQVVFEEDSQTHSTAKNNWNDYYYQKIRHLGIGKYYIRSSKISHTINWLVTLSLWVSFCILAAVRPSFFPLYLIFFGYLLAKALTYWLVKRKMDNGFLNWSFPILELAHLFVMPVFVIGGRVTTKVKWK